MYCSRFQDLELAAHSARLTFPDNCGPWSWFLFRGFLWERFFFEAVLLLLQRFGMKPIEKVPL